MRIGAVAGRYLLVGTALAGFGAVLAVSAFFILSNTPLSATGIACVVLGLTVASLPEYPVARKAARAIIRGSTMNIEELLEEFDVKERGIYLPPRDELVYVFVPLGPNPTEPTVEAIKKAPVRLISAAGGEPGLLILPPGAEAVRTLEFGEEPNLEEAIRYLLVEITELCSSVKVVERGNDVIVEMNGVKVETEGPKYKLALGSIPASLSACVVTTVTKRGAKIVDERATKNGKVAQFRLI